MELKNTELDKQMVLLPKTPFIDPLHDSIKHGLTFL